MNCNFCMKSMQTPTDDTEKYTKRNTTMRVIPSSECPSTTKTSPTMTILLDDYDHVHNKAWKYALSSLENYEEPGKKKSQIR